MVDEALESVGDFGEVKLVVEKGRVRFVVTSVSRDVKKWPWRRQGWSLH